MALLRQTVVVFDPHRIGTLQEDRMRKSLFVMVTVVTISIIAAACGSSDTAEPSTTEPPVAAGSTFNDADVGFAQGMIPHHSQAVEMATMALDQSSNPAIIDLAARIQGAQDPEVEQMRGWLNTWGQQEMSGEEITGEMEGMAHGSLEGMMDDTEMTALAATTGPEFDSLFVDMMIRHHQGAIVMANSLLTDGTDPEVRALAQGVIAAQEGEIAEMQGLDLG